MAEGSVPLTVLEPIQIMSDWNTTDAPYPDDTCIHQLFEAQAARTEVGRTRARLSLLAQAAGASGRGASLARLRFTGGAAGFLDVLDAERSLLDTERERAAGRTDAAGAAVGLYQAVGGAGPGGGAAPAGAR